MMDFAELLKLHMERRGLSQYSLSKLCGIGQSTLSRYLNNEFPPALDKVEIISKKLGMTLSEFFEEAESIEIKKPSDPQAEGFVAALTRPGADLSPQQAKAYALAAGDQAQRRRRLHQELDRLLDQYENKTPG